MIRRHLRRHAHRIAGFAFEFVFTPLGSECDDAIAGPFDDDLVALTTDLSEGTVGSDEVERVVVVVHELAGGNEIKRRLDAERDGSGGEQIKKDVERQRTCENCRCVERHSFVKSRVVEGGETEDYGEPVEPRVIAADDQDELMEDDERTGNGGDGLRSEEREGNDDLDEVAGQRGEAVHRRREAVEVPAQRVRKGLGFIVVVETGEIAPAGVVTQLDEAGANFGSEEHPAQDQDRDDGGLDPSRSKEGGEETGFQEHGLPAESEEALADVDDGEIQHIEQKPGGDGEPDRAGFCETKESANGNDETGPSDQIEETI